MVSARRRAIKRIRYPMTSPFRSALRLPPGVRDFLPRAAARRRAIAERLLDTFSSWGYARIIPPMFECADVLERGLGQNMRAAAIRFVEPGSGEVVALRPDFTPQVARIAATRMDEVAGPLRYCYGGSVMRMTSGARVQREILQAGVELIGASSPEADAEVLSVAAAALETMGIEHVRLDLGHVAIAHMTLGALEDAEVRRIATEHLSKKSRGDIRARLAREYGHRREVWESQIDDNTAAMLAALPTLYGAPAEVLKRARALPLSDGAHHALDTLETVLSLSREVLEEELHATISLDLGEVRGFDYYTGIRFSGYADGASGAVLRGGRYDELVGRYGRTASATGFAVDIEAIAEAQYAIGIAAPSWDASVLVCAGADHRRDGMRLASVLRDHGYSAAVDLGGARSDEVLIGYAREVGFAHAICLGEGEDGGARALSIAGGDEGGSGGGDDRGDGPAIMLSGKSISAALGGDAKALIQALERNR